MFNLLVNPAIKWIEYVSPVRFAFESLLTNEFEDLGFPAVTNPVKTTYGFDWGIYNCMYGLIFCCVLFRVLAFISLKVQAKTLG